jgi:hypothetical protein
MFDMAGKYKWDAWKKNEGKSSEQAKKEYVEAFLAVSTRRSLSSCAELIACVDRSWPRTPVLNPMLSRLISKVSIRDRAKAKVKTDRRRTQPPHKRMSHVEQSLSYQRTSKYNVHGMTC